MDIAKRILSTTEEKILKNDLLDVQEWVTGALDGKINNCWRRFQQEWTIRLMEDESFTDQIPGNQSDFITLVTSRSDYKNRTERDQEFSSKVAALENA